MNNDQVGKTMNNFTQRTLTGIVFVAFLILGILNPYSFRGLFTVITAIATWEFYTLAEKDQAQPQKIFGTFVSTLLFTIASFVATNVLPVVSLVILIPLFFSVLISELYKKSERPFTNIAYTLLGIVYVGLPFSLLNFLVFDHSLNFTPHIILGYFFLLWSSDTGAYLSGKSFGKHFLFPRISPKKTWEGSIGGAILSLIVAYIISLFYTELAAIHWFVISIIIVVMGTFGDLAESMFKRSIDIKDSGKILPGHGGMLDRFDGLFLSVPFIWTYLMLIYYFKAV